MKIKFGFPWNLYFRQLFATDAYVRFINPFNFWRRYKIEHLETCSELDLVEHLERCYQKKCPQTKSDVFGTAIANRQIDLDYKNYRNDIQKPRLSKTFFIVQSSENLKYRGVEYQKPKIVGIYFNCIASDSNSDEVYYPLTDNKDSDFKSQNNNLETS